MISHGKPNHNHSFFPSHWNRQQFTLYDDRFVVHCHVLVSTSVPTHLTWPTNRWQHDTMTTMDDDNTTQQWQNPATMRHNDGWWWQAMTTAQQPHADDCMQQQHGDMTDSKDHPLSTWLAAHGPSAPTMTTPPTLTMACQHHPWWPPMNGNDSWAPHTK